MQCNIASRQSARQPEVQPEVQPATRPGIRPGGPSVQRVRERARARLGWAGLVLVSASLLAGGCRSVLGIEDTDEVPDDCFPGTYPEGNGVSWWSTCNEEQACFSAGAPTRLDRPDASREGEDIETFFLANRTTHIGSRNRDGQLDENAWQDIGFDLDGVCTLSPPCESPGAAVVSCRTQSTNPPTDGKLCRDNQIGKLAYRFETQERLQGILPSDPEFNCALCRGDYNFILRVQGYNGAADDPAVRVDFYPSTGLTTLKDIDCTREDWDADQPACWTRTDKWNIQREGLEQPPSSDTDLTDSNAADPTAFVRASTLIVRMPPNTVMWYPSGDSGRQMLPLTVQEGTLTGTLRETEEEGWVLEDGLITGRTKGTDMLGGLERIGVCPGSEAHRDAEFFARDALDVLSSSEAQPDVPCDSLSLALTLTAAQAEIGVIESFPLPDECAAEPEPPVEPVEPAEPAEPAE